MIDSKVIPSARVVLLVENSTFRRDARSELGLAYWIEIPGHCILFDTGQSDLLQANARALNLPLDRVDSIILSHGHFDHTGGLAAALEAAPRAALFVHPDAFKPKFRKCPKSTPDNPQGIDIGLPLLTQSTIRARGHTLVPTIHPMTIREGIGVTGVIPRHHSSEIAIGNFFHDVGCQKPDQLADDQAIFFEVPEGLVLILGCAHAGVINTMEYVADLTGHDRFYCVMGGMHLEGVTRSRIDRTLQAFHDFGVQWIGLAHCTGIRAIVEFWATFPGRCFLCPVGTEVEFGKPIADHRLWHDYQI